MCLPSTPSTLIKRFFLNLICPLDLKPQYVFLLHSQSSEKQNSICLSLSAYKYLIWCNYTHSSDHTHKRFLQKTVAVMQTDSSQSAHSSTTLTRQPTGNPHLVAMLEVKVTRVGVKTKVNALTVVTDNILGPRILAGPTTYQLLKPMWRCVLMDTDWTHDTLLDVSTGGS